MIQQKQGWATSMLAWERRLKDLWLLLERCHATYMEPEQFRLGTNQFLQTARTVTFIIQKNKDSIPGFDIWYQGALSKWVGDEVMSWAKDSRNQIEKQGDLELHSSLRLTLFFSYLVEQDLQLATGRNELLQAGTKKLVRFARRHLPSHAIGSAAIKIERRWVANSLPGWELLHAFSYIYSTLHKMCAALSAHLGSMLDESLPEPTILYPMRELARQVVYLKLSDLKYHRQHIQRVLADPAYTPPPKIAAANLRERLGESSSPESVLGVIAELAQLTFEHDGFHLPMHFLFDESMQVVDFGVAQFADQIDKYIYWRNMADRAVATKATAIASIGEAWIRDNKHYHSLPVAKLPITGERLFVNLLCANGWFHSVNWHIRRTNEAEKPSLELIPDDEFARKAPFVFGPVIRAFGLPYPSHFSDEPTRR